MVRNENGLKSIIWGKYMDKNTEGLFKELIKEYQGQFKTTTMYGIPVEELNKEQLLACICWLGEEIDKAKLSLKEKQ